MKPLEFVKGIKNRIIENDTQVYQNLLETTNNSNDPIWNEILPIYSGLTKEQKLSFIKFIRLIGVNAVSHLFGILDGSTFLNEKRENFLLNTESNKDRINGDLQDIFLEIEED